MAPSIDAPEQQQSMADLAAVREARMRSLLANQGKTEPQAQESQSMPAPAPAPAQEANKPDLAELARLRAQRAAHLQRLGDGSTQTATGHDNSSSSPHKNAPEDPQVAALRAQREANLARLLQQSAAQASEIAQMEVDSEPSAPIAAACVINFRMPDGRSVVGEFSASEKFKTVFEYAAAFMPLGTIFNLMVPFPRHEFEGSDFDKTVAELGLTPRAALTVLTLDLRFTFY